MKTQRAYLTHNPADWCDLTLAALAPRSDSIPVGPIPRPQHILYPITGSIGLDKAVNTFLAIASQEGGDGVFIDELTFTTFTTGTVHPTVTLWRARYNLCVEEGRSHEDQINALRSIAPEIYCIDYTDAIIPIAASSGKGAVADPAG